MNDPLTMLPAVIAAIAPKARNDGWAEALAPPMRKAEITTPNRIAMFLGQICYESNGFVELSENLTYSMAARIRAVWPAHFNAIADAEPYVNNPVGLANLVYANRMGNGDVASGDGWRYRGSGLIQLTGRANHAAFAADECMVVADVPGYLREPRGAAASACWYWTTKHLNAYADRWDVQMVTRIINGGILGLAERDKLCAMALGAFSRVQNTT